MATTTSNRRAKAPRVALRQSIARYAAGEFSKRDIEKVFASALDHDSTCGEVIREYLDQQVHERALSRSIHKDLLEVLARHLPEDVPTETAEHMQDAASSKNSRQPEPAPQAAVTSAAVKPTPKPAVAVAEKRHSAPPAQPKQSVPSATASKPQDRQLTPGTVLRERFRLDEAVASGSMGLVFRATDLLKLEAGALSPVIAIKVINPEFSNNAAALRSFQNEVANTQHLSHPNIIRLFELDKDQGHYFITMEWLEGESLDALLDRSRGSALPPVQAYAIIEQLCDALIYAHGRQVIHADIKPGNVFLTKPGELKLIDFGIARIQNPHDSNGSGQESVALTPAYASCECLEHQTATEQDDLFSLACLIYRLLSGRRVFGTRTALQAEAERIEPVAIGGMSARRWQALRKALSYRRAGRQPDVRTFADEFGQRSEPRGRMAPEPDDAQFTETTTLSDVAEGDDANLHDTGSLRALNFPIELDDDMPHAAPARTDSAAQRLEMELELSDVMEASGVLELPEPINFFDDADCDDSVFVPVEESSGRFAVDTLTPIDSTVPPETRLATESTVPTETRVPTESTIPTGKSRSGTIEIEILKDLPLPGAADAPPPMPASNSLSLLDGAGPVVVRSPPPAVPVEVPIPAVKAAPKEPAPPPRSPVVEALTAAPVTLETPRPVSPFQAIIDAVLVRPRQLAAAAGGVLVVLTVVLLGNLGGDDNAAAVSGAQLAADGILVSPGSSAVVADARNGNQVEAVTERGPQQILVGAPDEAGSAIDAALVTASAAEPAESLNTADTGIAFDAATVPVPLPASRTAAKRPAPRLPPSTDTIPASVPSRVAPQVPAPDIATSFTPAEAAASVPAEASPAAVGEAAASSEAAADYVGDYDPNGPVPFSALELVHYVEPAFPEAYSEKTIEGWVDVRFSIDTAGTITELELLDTNLPPDFLPPSRAAVRQWRFKPFVWNGIPLAASTTVRLTYSN